MSVFKINYVILFRKVTFDDIVPEIRQVTLTLDQRFPYNESEERDPLVARSEAFQMIGPIKLSHSTGGIWV